MTDVHIPTDPYHIQATPGASLTWAIELHTDEDTVIGPLTCCAATGAAARIGASDKRNKQDAAMATP